MKPLAIAVTALSVAVAVSLVVGVLALVQVAGLAKQATGALCTLRSDLDQRVRTSQAFLRDHPHGIPGIPAKTIQDGIRNQQRTIVALSDIDCSKS